MHKTWPNPKFPNCVCVTWDGVQVPASPWPHAAAVLCWGFHGDQRWGWQERRARRRFLCLEGQTLLFWGCLQGEKLQGVSFPFSLVGAEQSPWVAAGLSALLGHWGRWRPARAGGDDGKGWVASKCGDPHASLLGAHPRCWVGIRCAHSPCEVLAACGWGVRVQGVWDSWDVVTTEQTRVLVKNNLGMSTLHCLRLMRLIGAFPPGSLCREVQRFGFSRWVPLSEGWGGSKNVIKGLSSWNWVNKSLWSVFPSVPYALDGNGSRCKLSFYFFNCLQMLMLPFV